MTEKEVEQIREFIKETRIETRKECWKVMGEASGLDLGDPKDFKRLQDIIGFGGSQLDMNKKISDQVTKVTVGMCLIAFLGYVGSLVYSNLFVR